MKKKILRYLRDYPHVRAVVRGRIILRSRRCEHSPRCPKWVKPRPRYHAYKFERAWLEFPDGRRMPLTGLAFSSKPVEETREAHPGVFLPTGFSIEFTLPPSASYLFARPDSDPRLN